MSWLGLLLTFSLVEHVLFARMLGLDPGTAEGSNPAAPRRPVSPPPCLQPHPPRRVGPAGARVCAARRRLAADARDRPRDGRIASLARLVLGHAAPRAADLFGPVLRPSGVSVAALGTVFVTARSDSAPESLAAGLAAGAGLAVALSILAGIETGSAPGKPVADERPAARAGVGRPGRARLERVRPGVPRRPGAVGWNG